MCIISSLYGDQAITNLLKSCKGWGKVLWEIQFEFKIQTDMDHYNRPSKRLKLKSINNVVELKDNELGSFPYNWFLERSNDSISSFQSHSGIVSEIPTFFKIIP